MSTVPQWLQKTKWLQKVIKKELHLRGKRPDMEKELIRTEMKKAIKEHPEAILENEGSIAELLKATSVAAGDFTETIMPVGAQGEIVAQFPPHSLIQEPSGITFMMFPNNDNSCAFVSTDTIKLITA